MMPARGFSEAPLKRARRSAPLPGNPRPAAAATRPQALFAGVLTTPAPSRQQPPEQAGGSGTPSSSSASSSEATPSEFSSVQEGGGGGVAVHTARKCAKAVSLLLREYGAVPDGDVMHETREAAARLLEAALASLERHAFRERGSSAQDIHSLIELASSLVLDVKLTAVPLTALLPSTARLCQGIASVCEPMQPGPACLQEGRAGVALPAEPCHAGLARLAEGAAVLHPRVADAEAVFLRTSHTCVVCGVIGAPDPASRALVFPTHYCLEKKGLAHGHCVTYRG